MLRCARRSPATAPQYCIHLAQVCGASARERARALDHHRPAARPHLIAPGDYVLGFRYDCEQTPQGAYSAVCRVVACTSAYRVVTA